ncbi:MAG: peptidase C39 family protein, partial [Gammaproteobacteria bacterium]|nr:peptidase C39 family protein [Gammaproteobacteria bacterium]
MEKPAVPPADRAKLACPDRESRAQAAQVEKSLITPPHRIPYYRQTLDFTCGPAALMMAMKALDSKLPFNRKLEL